MNDDALFYMDVLQTLASKRRKPLIPYHADFTVTDFVVTSEGRFKFTLNAYAEPNGFFYKISIHADNTKITCFERKDGVIFNHRIHIVPSLLNFIVTAVVKSTSNNESILSMSIELTQLQIDNKNLRNRLDRVKKLVCQ
jgi:hypothetical protein